MRPADVFQAFCLDFGTDRAFNLIMILKQYIGGARRIALWIVLGLAGHGLLLAQNPVGTAHDEAQVWARAGEVRIPANRAVVVAEIQRIQAARREAAIERARRLGLPIREIRPDGGARELMGWEDEHPLYYSTRNVNAAISSASDSIRVSPYFADGSHWTLGVWDGGAVRATHQEFGGRATVMDGASLLLHATHVCGTIGAAGITPSAIGMATAVGIDSYDWTDDSSEMAARGASYGGEAGKIYISNHSYGYLSGWYNTGGTSPAWIWYGSGTDAAASENDFGKYNTYSRDLDTLAHSLPYYLIFWAAGNDRSDNPSTGQEVALNPNDTATLVNYDPALHPPGDGVYRGGYEVISYNALAKNVMTVGAVNDAVTSGQRDLSKAAMTSFSSWGPPDDGRIKPDIVANGYSLYSTSSSGDTSYTWMSGTSMATPSASGTAQQILDDYGSLFPGRYLRAETLKGLLIHTADDLGNPGPDYKFGWGLLNAKAAADLIADMHTNPAVPRMYEQELTDTAPEQTHDFSWDGVSPIKATLCWTDPAGVATTEHDSRTPRLVNNLDLRIEAPGGTQHFPWVMPFVGAWTEHSMSLDATPGVNDVDNVEQVLISAPSAPGVYQAVVSFTGSLVDNSQSYALFIDGTGSPSPPAPDPQSISPDFAETGTVAITITGEAFAAGAAAAFFRDGLPEVSAAVSGVTPSTIECRIDAGTMAQGLWSLRVTNPDGQTGALPDAFAVVDTLFSRNFDPDAPGWTAYLTTGTGGSGWTLTSTQSHTPPNAWFVPGPGSVQTDNLESEGIAIPFTAGRLRLHFWHRYNTELSEGCLLEVSPNDGVDWYEIGAGGSGATFVQGGYTTAVQNPGGNPHYLSEFVDRSAWTGNSGGIFSEVIVALDAATYKGQTLRARWRFGTGRNGTSEGWYVDSVRISGYDTAILPPSPPAPRTLILVH